MAELALVEAPARTWRIERAEPVLAFSQVDVIDASVSTGNRFDVPGAGILYAATTPAGAFAETLARFRPKASLIEKMRRVQDVDDSHAHLPPGAFDPSWFGLRRQRSLRMVDPLPFVDVDDPHTHTYLTEHAAGDLLGLGLDNLDVATLRGLAMSAGRSSMAPVSRSSKSNASETRMSSTTSLRRSACRGDL